MCFNNKDEFNRNSGVLTRAINFMIKYKKVFFIGIVIIILLILMVMLFMKDNRKFYLILNGEEIITIYQGADYVEPGYNAYNSLDEDLTSKVTIESNLNNDVVGEYEIVYTIGDVSKIRIVKVIDKPEDYTFIHLTSVNNSVNIYLKKGEEYKEPGYLALSSTGEDLTSKVEISGKVDTSKKGTYKLTYSVIDRYGVTISVSRKVIVMDSDISLTLDNEEYTNKEVTININIIDEYFDYMILPDNTKVTTNTYSYKVSSNGTYIFKVYNKKGGVKASSIEVKNIDKTAPSGSCSGSFENGVSTINVSAKDNIGISKYVINGQSYMGNKITIDSELKNVEVVIYDKAGNSKSVSCNLEDKNRLVLFDKSITFDYQYVDDDDLMSYALFTPSIDNGSKKIPLIVWLHGSGEVNSWEVTFKNSGLLKVINEWQLEGFNAYILCPHLSDGEWLDARASNGVYTLIDKIVSEYNVDTSKIIMSGHSLGGYGAENIVYNKKNYFSAMVIMSSYYIGLDLSKIKDVPTKGFVGSLSKGEQQNSYYYMIGGFKSTFDSVKVLSASHGDVPNVAFNLDENGDGRSDLIEWMLTQ